MRDVKHFIQLVSDYRFHHQAPYRLSIPEANELKRQLEELLRLGFIKPSNSPWGVPVLFARKADGTLRLCIDYRGLNRYTVKNSYPMPRSDELFDRLAGNRFFTKIDLRSGYHQIRVAAADQPKTAFRSRFGHYEFTVMPFGFTNAPVTFQRVMKDVFSDILEQYVLIYLDDILVYSRTLEEHLRHLRDVLDCLSRHDFYAKLSKCRFAQHNMDFLGHYVSDHGLHMDDAKITAIADGGGESGNCWSWSASEGDETKYRPAAYRRIKTEEQRNNYMDMGSECKSWLIIARSRRGLHLSRMHSGGLRQVPQRSNPDEMEVEGGIYGSAYVPRPCDGDDADGGALGGGGGDVMGPFVRGRARSHASRRVKLTQPRQAEEELEHRL
ncbi:hypothetical protein CBR_g30628 [Chara braunii]|uniref:Reverse transcriptase domain-containing protein n=1 Tax=Chara braunii TaxID=69332 RepID=A0A388LDH0_CHABU|nr:hypothetical protein CBR_g30628 [Chara braunii]|eukprot:GBG80262.1 hypothetical protein CBR_g30628 [Chara braunii]